VQLLREAVEAQAAQVGLLQQLGQLVFLPVAESVGSVYRLVGSVADLDPPGSETFYLSGSGSVIN